MNKKGQAAMEFLMTYGWAILVVLAAIGALAYFGVLSPSALLPERTTFTAPIPSVDTAVIRASDDTVTIAFRNNVGSTITIDNVSVETGGDCGSVSSARLLMDSVDEALPPADPEATRVQNGEAFRVEVTCGTTLVAGERFKSAVTVEYTNTETSLTRPHTGSVEGRVVQ